MPRHSGRPRETRVTRLRQQSRPTDRGLKPIHGGTGNGPFHLFVFGEGRTQVGRTPSSPGAVIESDFRSGVDAGRRPATVRRSKHPRTIRKSIMRIGITGVKSLGFERRERHQSDGARVPHSQVPGIENRPPDLADDSRMRHPRSDVGARVGSSGFPLKKPSALSGSEEG